MTSTVAKTIGITGVRRFVVTIHKSGSRRFRHVTVRGVNSEYEAAAYAQKHLCKRGETASHAYEPRLGY